MYLPEHFEETQPEEHRRIMAANPLGAFVINGPNGLDAITFRSSYVLGLASTVNSLRT